MSTLPPPRKGGALAKLCALFCADEDFQVFLMRRFTNADYVGDAIAAAAVVREVCKVKSRKEFDHDEEAAERFHTQIRIPYVAWQKGRNAQA